MSSSTGDPFDDSGLPDPDDTDEAWSNGSTAYGEWWERLHLWAQRTGRSRHQAFEVGCFQRRLLERYAYAVPNAAALEALLNLGPLLEIGAGGGYWARLLRDSGADVLASDIEPDSRRNWAQRKDPWTAIERGDVGLIAACPERSVFLCWPTNGLEAGAIRAAAGRRIALVSATLGNPMFASRSSLEAGWRLQRAIVIPTWSVRGDSLTIWEPRADGCGSN